MFGLARYTTLKVSILFGFLNCLFLPVYAESGSAIQDELQKLEQRAFELQADINNLERDILFPPLLRTDLYVAIKPQIKKAKKYSVRRILVKVNTAEVIDYRYSQVQSNALFEGGKQLLWQGNLALGEHRFEVAYEFVNASNRVINSSESFIFTKVKEQPPLILSFLIEGEKPSVSLSPVQL